MRKKYIPVLCIVLLGQLLYSCSDFILPKQVQVEGTVNLPSRIGTIDLSTLLADSITIPSDLGDIYGVDYSGQQVQAFCIYIPMDISDGLNPSQYLSSVGEQLTDISGDAIEIRWEISIPYVPGISIPISQIIQTSSIPDISLKSIAKMVKSINFAACEGTVENGIGFNFHFTEVIPGLEMIVTCEGDEGELYFSGEARPLVIGDNIFGNSEDCELNLARYKDDVTKLTFNVQFQSNDPNNRDILVVSDPSLQWGDMLHIAMEVHFFQNWTGALIDTAEALQIYSEESDDLFTGTIPDVSNGEGYLDLSSLGTYLDNFTFNDKDVDAKVYLSGPSGEGSVFSDIELSFSAHYGNGENEIPMLSIEGLELDNTPISAIIDQYLDGKETDANNPDKKVYTYNNEKLPPGGIDLENFSSIVSDCPKDLFFTYTIRLPETMYVTPEMFGDETDDSNHKIAAAIMIMLPLKLYGAGTISLSSMFSGVNDLLGRSRVSENLFGQSIDVQKITMTIDFFSSMFTGGHLYIDKIDNYSSLLFSPNGIALNGKRITIDFNEEQLAIVRDNLIKPNIWIQFDDNGTITIPKNTDIASIQFEIKGLIKTGDL